MTAKGSSSLTRADAIRARRSNQGETRVNHAVDRATAPILSTPVVSRNSMAGAPAVRKAHVSTRKKVVYTKTKTGAEVRLPAIPVLHPGWRLLSFALASISLAILYFLWTAPLFKVQAATLTGSERVTADEVNAILQIGGKRMIELQPAEMAATLQKSLPAVKSVRVSAGFPAEVSVSIVDRQPVIEWMEFGTTRWIDEEGYSFDPRGEGKNLISVNVSTNAATAGAKQNKNKASEVAVGDSQSTAETATVSSPDEPYLDTGLIQSIKTLAGYVPEGSQIVYNDSYGLGWYAKQGWNVYFGADLSDLDAKIKVYDALEDELVADGISAKIINLEYLDAPYYR